MRNGRFGGPIGPPAGRYSEKWPMGGSLASKTGPPVGHPAPLTRSAEMKHDSDHHGCERGHFDRHPALLSASQSPQRHVHPHVACLQPSYQLTPPMGAGNCSLPGCLPIAMRPHQHPFGPRSDQCPISSEPRHPYSGCPGRIDPD
jgi:hypothetical protein